MYNYYKLMLTVWYYFFAVSPSSTDSVHVLWYFMGNFLSTDLMCGVSALFYMCITCVSCLRLIWSVFRCSFKLNKCAYDEYIVDNILRITVLARMHFYTANIYSLQCSEYDSFI